VAYCACLGGGRDFSFCFGSQEGISWPFGLRSRSVVARRVYVWGVGGLLEPCLVCQIKHESLETISVRRRLQISRGCYTPASTTHGGGGGTASAQELHITRHAGGNSRFLSRRRDMAATLCWHHADGGCCVHPACGLALTLEQLVPLMAQQAAASNVR
jgi:hypothetical protein